MRRLAAIDWLLLGTSMPIILIGIVGSVVHGVRGDFVVPPFLVTSAADQQSYPVVGRILASPSTEVNPLAVGDRLLRLEGRDLRGASFARFMLRWSETAQAGARSLLFTIERGGLRSDVRVFLVPGNNVYSVDPQWWAAFPFVISVVGTGLLLLVRASHWHLARRNYVVCVLLALLYMPYFAFPMAPRIELCCTDGLAFPLANGLLLWNLNELLPGLELWGPGQRAVAWTLGLLHAAAQAAGFWMPGATLTAGSLTGFAISGFSVAFLVALTRVYRRADPPGRRQIKWVVYGIYVAAVASGLWGATFAIAPEWTGTFATVSYLAQVAKPLGFLIAIAYYQFLDIDRLFSATLSYSLLATLGLAVLLGIEPEASHAVSDILGVDPAIGQVLMALGLAAVLVPAYRIVRPWIDRWFFPERATLEHGFTDLLGEISTTADMHELTNLVGERLDALLRPAVAVLYTRAGEQFTPLAARGRSEPPAFAARSALIAALQERTTPLAAKRWSARQATFLTPFERAAIETLDAAVLVPIRRGAELAAFWCLGPKRSGDIYTPTDLALLGAMAGTISARLHALGATEAAGEYPHGPVLGSLSPNPEPPQERMGPALNKPFGKGSPPYQGGVRGGFEMPREQPLPGPLLGKEGEEAATAAEACVFRREGEFWTLAYRGQTARLRDTKGLHYIARLPAAPGRELHVRDLATGNGHSENGDASRGLHVERELGAILDARATAEYKERLAEARQELDEATAAGDLGQAARAREEIEAITEQLAAAYGLGGRPRTAGDPSERVRKAVTNQIRRALDRIGAAHPELGRHLTNALRTGFVCSYHPEYRMTWRL